MLLLQLPNIVCITFNDKHGWYVVAGSIIAIITNAYITYIYLSKTNINETNINERNISKTN